MLYPPNSDVTLFIVATEATYRYAKVHSSGSNGLFLKDAKSSAPLGIAYDPAKTNQGVGQVIEMRRSESETKQRAIEIWGHYRYQIIVKNVKQLFTDATSGAGVQRLYSSLLDEDDQMPKTFVEYWEGRFNHFELSPVVRNVTGTPFTEMKRPFGR